MKVFSPILFIFMNLQAIYGQSFSLGFNLGGSNYDGDMTYSKTAVIQQTNLSFGLHVQYELDPFFNLRLGMEKLKVSANDNFGIQDWQLRRDLNFTCEIYSFDLSGMLNLKNLLIPKFKSFNFYVLGGYTGFYYNPVTNFQGNTVELRPLGTEGQGMKGYKEKYSTWAGAINFGFNFEYLLNSQWSIESQLLLRKTNTDYIDDLSTNYVDYEVLSQQNGTLAAQIGNKIKAPQGSQRGNPIDNDWYQSLSIGIHYKFNAKNQNNLSQSKKPKVNCPKFKI